MEDLLEEIVGNIYDESDDKPEPDIVKLEDNLWRVSGSADIDELAEAIGIDLDFEDEDYGTLGGLVYSQLSQIPEDGSKPEIEAKGMRVKVEKISEHRVESALVSVLPPEVDSDENSDDNNNSEKETD